MTTESKGQCIGLVCALVKERQLPLNVSKMPTPWDKFPGIEIPDQNRTGSGGFVVYSSGRFALRLSIECTIPLVQLSAGRNAANGGTQLHGIF